MSGLTDDECLAVLRSVSAGTRVATPDRAPRAVYAGNVTYRTDDGWTIVVFNDCDSWDYVDAIRAPDGRERRICDDREDVDGPVWQWVPEDTDMVARWGWPEPPPLPTLDEARARIAGYVSFIERMTTEQRAALVSDDGQEVDGPAIACGVWPRGARPDHQQRATRWLRDWWAQANRAERAWFAEEVERKKGETK